MKSVLTISGKPATISAGFRIPLDKYQQVIEHCRKRGVTVSTATGELWKRELEKEVSKDANAK